MELPHFHWVEQELFSEKLTDIAAAVQAEVARVLPPLKPGARIAVTAGSRGVANIPVILRAVCAAIRQAGGQPFLVPAMGTHGGATAEGQVNVLASLGVTEASVGVPILSSMEVVLLGRTADNIEIYCDRNASEADGIVLVERIKPHTDFTGIYESGLAKMMAIGLGKQAGALRIHSFGARGLREIIPQAAEIMLAKAPVLAGLAIMENGIGQTWRVAGLSAAEIMAHEPELLEMVKSHTPRLPFDEADLLIVDYIGKEISGAGMDTKTLGRIRIAGEAEPASPQITAVIALDVTEASHGNAIGAGLADVTTMRLANKVDFKTLAVNASASGFWERGKIPLAMPSDAQAIAAPLRFCRQPATACICRIRDTAHLNRIAVSEALLPALYGKVKVSGEYSLPFDTSGNLTDHDTFPN